MDATRPSCGAVAEIGPSLLAPKLSAVADEPARHRSWQPVGGIVFDAANVLYDATLWSRKLLRLVRGLGVTTSDAQFLGDWQRHYLSDVHCGRREYAEAFQSFLLRVGLSWAQIDEVEAASRIERQLLELGLRPLAGVVGTIGRLDERGIRMVAWADAPCPAADVAACIARLGLAGKFAAVLSSFDLEAAQPDARCYTAALNSLGLDADRTAYVGHDARHLAGAKDAGMCTIAFNYQADAAADFHLTAFEELLTLVDALPGPPPWSRSSRSSLFPGPALLATARGAPSPVAAMPRNLSAAVARGGR